jgi:hypothetical protein
MAMVYALLWLRFPLRVIYTCPRTNLDKLTRVEATPTGLPLLHYTCPLENLDNLTHPDLRTGLAVLLGVLLLFGAYALGAVALRETNDGRRRTKDIEWRIRPPSFVFRHEGRLLKIALIGFPLLFVLLLLPVYPATSVDLFDYLFRGRMAARYAANTFVRVPQDFSSDPLFDFVAWRRAVTAYGPLWEALSWLTARLAGETHTPAFSWLRDAQLLRLMLAFKALSTLGFVLCGAAIWAALGRLAPAYRRLGLYLWLWNPLVLWESAGAGHNDAWMALCIVLAVWAFAGRAPNIASQEPDGARLALARPVAAFLALIAGALIKFLPLFLGPLFLSAALRQQPSRSARLRLVLWGGLACLVVMVLAYAPFWVGWDTFRNFGDRAALFTATWPAVLQAELIDRGVDKLLAQQSASLIGLWLLLGGTVWSAWRAWRAPDKVAAHALWLLLWFLFVCNPWFQPWYMIWPLALVALQPWRTRLLLAVGLLCCTAMLACYVAWTFMRPQLGWGVNSAAWNALLCLLIYGPPLLVLGTPKPALSEPVEGRLALDASSGINPEG